LRDDVAQRVLVALFGRKLVQLRGLAERLVDATKRVDDELERGPLAA
jgi:hypothetical protein